jgi:hypothetical protein
LLNVKRAIYQNARITPAVFAFSVVAGIVSAPPPLKFAKVLLSMNNPQVAQLNVVGDALAIQAKYTSIR